MGGGRRRRAILARPSGPAHARRPGDVAVARAGSVPLPAVRPAAAEWRGPGPGSGARPASPVQRAEPPGASRSGRAAHRRRVRPFAPGARDGPGRHGGRGRGQVRGDPVATPRLLLLRPRRAARRLDGLPLPLLLRDQRLALVVLGRQRPRSRLGAVLRLRRGARRRVVQPGVVRPGGPRRSGGRSAPPLGRPDPQARGRPPGHLRRGRLPRRVRRAGGVPAVRSAPPAAARPVDGDRHPAVLDDDARPGRRWRVRRGHTDRRGPVRGLRTRRRGGGRAWAGARMDADSRSTTMPRG